MLKTDAPPLRFGAFEWHGAGRRLLVGGRPAPLGTRALDLLAVLIERRDHVVSKNELLDLVWPGLVVEENNLQVQVSALRKVLGPEVIATIPGRGYRFDVPGTAHRPAAPAARPTASLCGGAPPLIGRDGELARLLAALQTHRLVTVVGPGGIGKTRLALAAADAATTCWPQGARVVPLADLHDPAQLPAAVAQATETPLPSGATGLAGIVDALRPQSLLLLLDNAEHLVEAVAALAAALLAGAPGVGLLVTSQLRLKLAQEQVVPLPPLSCPAVDDVRPDERYGAVQLFVHRARAAQPDFALAADSAALVADICRRLDGLPLAIELAAARVRALGLQGLHVRLDERLRLLTGGHRDAPGRQRTLQAALEWSHALLDADEQAVLRRLGVFVGGFTLELAQAVAVDDETIDGWRVLDLLAALVEKSWVGVDGAEPLRYRLLDSPRAFALQQLQHVGEASGTARRHARAVTALFVRLDQRRLSDDETIDADAQRAILSPEVGNARAALDWAMGPDGDPGLAATLAAASANVFMQLGLTLEMLPRLQALRAAADQTLADTQRCDFWRRLAMLGAYGGLPYDEVREAGDRALDAARRAGGRRRLHASLSHWGYQQLAARRMDAVKSALDEMASLERTGDPPFQAAARLGLEVAWLISQSRHAQALDTLQAQQALLEAAPGESVALLISRANLCTSLNVAGRFEESAALAERTLQDPRLPAGLNVVGFDLIHALAALGRADEAWSAARRLRHRWHLSPVVLHGSTALSLLALARGRIDDALRLAGAGQAWRGARQLPEDALVEQLQQRLRQACSALGIDDDQQRRWRSEGAALTDEALIERALLGQA